MSGRANAENNLYFWEDKGNIVQRDTTAIFVCRETGGAAEQAAGQICSRRRFAFFPKMLTEISDSGISYVFPNGDDLRLQQVYDNLISEASPGKGYGPNGWGFVASGRDGKLIFLEGGTILPTEEEINRILSAFECEADRNAPHFSVTKGSYAPAALEEEISDEKYLAVKKELDAITDKYNISIDDISAIIGRTAVLSRMRITGHGAIFLTDYNNAEVKLDPLSKALYFLYLRHPEGIAYKELFQYREELLQLYSGLSARSDQSGFSKSIDDLVNPFNNAVNVKVSRIRNAFLTVVCDRIARNYYITGSAGERKTVTLDRSLVIRE